MYQPAEYLNRKGEKRMEIQKTAIAGTLESSDAQITIEPFTEGLDILIESSVMNQYGRQIKATIIETLENLNVTNAKVLVIDKGALACTLKSRLECAVFRSLSASEENIPWGGIVK